MLLLTVTLLLGGAHGLLPENWTPVDVELKVTTEPNLAQETPDPSGILNKTEETQHALEDAANQMDSESATSSLPVNNLTSSYSESSTLETAAGNRSVPVLETIDKNSDDSPEDSEENKIPIRNSSYEKNTSHECLFNENCDKGFYCQYELQHSECAPCKSNETCRADEECCEDQLCVFGQCTKNVTRGDAGTICKTQSDCRADMCCTYHKALLAPVCLLKPKEFDHCIIKPNPLTDYNPDRPKLHCPCAGELQCQHRSRGSVCLKGQSASEEDLTDTLYSDIDYII